MTGAKTQLLTLSSTAATQSLAAPAAAAPVLPLVSRLRALREERGANLVTMLAPFTSGLSTRALLREVASGLIQIHEGPVLAVSLVAGPAQDVGRTVDLNDLSGSEPTPDGEEALRQIRDSAPSGLCFVKLSTDPRSRLAFVSSERFPALIAAARQRYRHTLIEGSGAELDAETILAARASDGTILVAGRGVTRTSQATDASRMLASCGVRLLGYVFDRNPVVATRKK